MEQMPVVLAGGTGNLGGRIAHDLRALGAPVRALVRPATDPARTAALTHAGVDVVPVDFGQPAALAGACAGAACVVSALSGLRGVIVDAQSALLDAAVVAGVPRFIPSDFAIDFTKLPDGSNRNFDLRRAFRRRLDAAPIAATSVLCGMFTGRNHRPLPSRDLRSYRNGTFFRSKRVALEDAHKLVIGAHIKLGLELHVGDLARCAASLTRKGRR